MANENVKVIINEHDATEAQGSGTSSDIVYIPGLAIDSWPVENPDGSSQFKRITTTDYYDDDGQLIHGQPALTDDGYWNPQAEKWSPVKNKPILCNTVEEFESYFGDRPYEMTADDVDGTYIKNYHENDYDKSYIYAKELLNAGISVIYEYIADENSTKNVGTTELIKVSVGQKVVNEDGVATIDWGSPFDPDDESANVCNCNLRNLGNNKFNYTRVCKHIPDTYQCEFSTKLSSSLTGAAGKVRIIPNFTKVDSDGPTVSLYPGDPASSIQLYIDGVAKSDDRVEVTYNEPDNTYPNGTYDISWVNLSDRELRTLEVRFTVLSTDESFSGNGKSVCWTIDTVDISNSADTSGEIGTASKITYLYDHLGDALDRIEDKSEYSVKYITSGGYPTFVKTTAKLGDEYVLAYVLHTSMLDCAYQRGDAVALIDHIDDPRLPLSIGKESGSIYSEVSTHLANAANAEYGTMFTPWASYTCSTVDDISRKLQYMPASFGYLMALAKAIKTSPNWLAMAGITRGLVPNIATLHTGNYILTNAIAEDYQPKYGSDSNKISINAITNIKPYGLTLWGNRTLKPVDPLGTKATNFLNIRNMVSDIKKLAYSTARALMFEQDSDSLWLRFKSSISPLLDQLKSGNGISEYKIIRGTTKYNGKALTKGELAAVIKIIPRYAIEYFEITVVMADDDVTVS